MFSEKSCREFINELSSKAPVPGGGGASALAGSVAAALGCMVGNMTLGKKKYAHVEEEIKSLICRTEELQNKLLDLVDEDAKAFGPLAKAYGLPSETEEEKETKDRVMADALRDATLVPLEIMRKCCECIELLEEYAVKGSQMVISDAGVGVILAKSALQGAALNVFINTKLIKNRDFAEEVETEADQLLEKYKAKADKVYELVVEKVRR